MTFIVNRGYIAKQIKAFTTAGKADRFNWDISGHCFSKFGEYSQYDNLVEISTSPLSRSLITNRQIQGRNLDTISKRILGKVFGRKSAKLAKNFQWALGLSDRSLGFHNQNKEEYFFKISGKILKQI